MSISFERSGAAPIGNVEDCKVLLVGFPAILAGEMIEIMSAAGLEAMDTKSSVDAARLCASTRYDFVLLEIDGVDLFAPTFVANLTSGDSPSKNSTIVAFGGYFMPAFKDRLVECGVDGIYTLPIDADNLVAFLEDLSCKRANYSLP